MSDRELIDIFAKEIVTLDEIKELELKRYITDALIKEGQISTVYGNGGAGKTSLILYFALSWIEDFYKQVVYINMDGDNPMTKPLQEAFGDKFVNIGKGSSDSVIPNLLKVTDEAIQNTVLIFDTYKKFTGDVNSKGANVILFEKLRRLQVKGATIIMLAHTNKDKKSHSGTADIEQDGDCMLRVSGIKDGKVLTVSIKKGGRTRWEVIPKTFTMEVDKYPNILTCRESDTFKDLQQVENELEDMPHIEAVKEIINDHPFIKTTELLKVIGESTALVQRESRALLYRYEGLHWNRHKQTDNKTYKWSIVEKA